jgi:hypothetical protein
MKITKFFTLLVAFFTIQGGFGQAKEYIVHTVGFYNLENLFDIYDDPTINDEEWLPGGPRAWSEAKYQKKLTNLSRVLAEIGTGENKNSPVIMGVSEVENRKVLEDLVKQPTLVGKDYGIVHYDSPDRRGIDVGLLYQKKHFKPTSSANIPLYIYSDPEPQKKKDKDDDDDKTDDETKVEKGSRRIYTRDQLLVTGLLDGEEISILVVHWPSRSGGEKKSSPLREAAARLTRKITDSLYNVNPDAKVIILGDLNDGSFNKSVKVEIGAKGKKEQVKERGVYNPFESMANKGYGTIGYRDSWDIFDIIMVTEPLIREDRTTFRYWKAGIYNKPYMIQTTGAYKGYPLRNTQTEPGFSDHFPVYIYLIKERKK